MIRSMTAFSRKELKETWGNLSWELRSVNHRYLEVTPRLPEQLRELENGVREKLRKRLSRGKLECTLKLKTENAAPTEIKVNEAYVKQLLDAAHQIQTITGDSSTLSTTALLGWQGVIETPETDMSHIQQTAMSLLDATLDDFIAHREREGAELKKLIQDRLDGILAQVEIAKQHMPEILQNQRERINTKLEEAQVNLDQERLEQEMVFIAQKADIDEELDRLSTHVEEVRRSLNKGGASGRRLDFLMQELNREANTLGSKSIHVVTTQVAVELKVLIEQMREQIQNIE
ncbi:MAG: YicC family protein [Pseudomonadales bacterium]|nr:YicC family protein [Pseudomonadales bacterium]